MTLIKWYIMFISIALLVGMVQAEDIELELKTPGTMFLPGSMFKLDMEITNYGSDHDQSLIYVALNVGTDDYWFYPDWVRYPPGLDCMIMDINGFSNHDLNIIPEFDWPADTGEFFNASFIAAVVSTNGSLISNIPILPFGWTSSPMVSSIDPVYGPPGKRLKISGGGFDLAAGEIKVLINGYQFPVISTGVDDDGLEYVITLIPPLASSQYDVKLITNGLESNSISLFIEDMASTGKPQGQVLDEVSLGMKTLFSKIETQIIPDAVSDGLIPAAAQVDYQETIDRANMIFNAFYAEIAALPSDHKDFLESVIAQNGLDEIFSEISSTSPSEIARGDVSSFMACLALDTTSACLTAVDQAWSLVDLATIIAAILSGGAGLPAAGGSFGVHYAIIIVDATLDGFFPIDLQEITLQGQTGALYVHIDHEAEYKIQGVFDNQKPPLQATFGVVLSTFLEGLGPFLPANVDEQLRNWIIGKLSSMGLNLGDSILGEDIMNWGDPSPEIFYVDFFLYGSIDLNNLLAMSAMFVNAGPMLQLMNQFNLNVFPETGITVSNLAILDYDLDQEVITITGKATGSTSITFNAFSFTVTDAWWNILGVELPGPITKHQEVIVSAASDPTPTPSPATATPTPNVPTPTPTHPVPTPTPQPSPADLVYVPPGSYLMGSSPDELCHYANEEPVHTVTLTQGFYILKTEVTQQQWIDVFGTNPSTFQGMNRPVESVTWYDACIYCNRLSSAGGLTPCYYEDELFTTVFDGTPPVNHGDVYWNPDANGYRLPTEAEWEYACRAGTTGPYNSGEINTSCGSDSILDPLAWYKYTSDTGNGRETHDVGTKQSNALGLFDMHGNVEEWCWDGFDFDYYASSPTEDPTGPEFATNRVKRGGAYSRGAGTCRSAERLNSGPGIPSSLGGFRLAQ